LVTLSAGTKVYDVYGTSQRIRYSIIPWFNDRYARNRRNSAEKIGELRLTSDFKASAFGDSGVFFKHQRYEDR